MKTWRIDWRLVALIAAFVAWRAILLVWSPYVYDEEEYKTGSIAHLILHGAQVPLLELTPGDYEGGTLLVGLLSVLPFRVLGENFFALKAVAVGFSLVLLISVYLLLKRLVSARAGLLAGCFLLLAPPYISQITLLPWGNYAEAAALSALTFLLALPLFESANRNPLRLFGLGLLAGLGTYMHYGYLVAPLTVVLMWLGRDRLRIFSLGLLAFCAGALIGFAPWIVYNATHDFRGLVRIADAIGAPGSGAPVGLSERMPVAALRCARLFVSDLPAAFHFNDSLGLPRRVWAYLWYLPALAALLYAAWRARRALLILVRGGRWPESGFVAVIPLYLALYALIFSLTDYGLFRSGWDSLDPETHAHIFVMLPWLAACLGIAGDRLLSCTRQRAALTAALLLPAAIAGLAGQLSLLRPGENQLERLRSNAWDEGIIYVEIGSKWARNPDRLWEIGGRLNLREARYFSFGVGIDYGLVCPRVVQRPLGRCSKLPQRFAPYCYTGIGTGIIYSTYMPLEERHTAIDAAPPELLPFVEAGAAIGEIWLDATPGIYCARGRDRDFSGIASPEEREALSEFIDLQLKMIEVQPPK